MRVTLIGSGNVATILGRLIRERGHDIIQVYGRNRAAVTELAKELNADGIVDRSQLHHNSDLFLIAVSDNAIEAIAGSIDVGNHLVVHTAGSVSREVLRQSSKNYGVLYPLQSLRKEVAELPEIPLLVDGNTREDLTLLLDFAGSLSAQVRQADDAERMHYHLAAVFANNFTNHLYEMAENYCSKNGAEFRLLLPLIEQLPARLRDHSAAQLQTGPAKRNDRQTMEKHLQMLNDMPVLQSFYEQFSKSIARGLK